LQPLIQIILFTIIFGQVAKIPTGDIPYFLFSTVAIIPWTYMAQSMAQSSQSLVMGSAMLGKIYFPRLLYPITPILSRFLDFVISILILIIVALFYRVSPSVNLLYFPLFVIVMLLTSAGVGMWTSALAIRFRDVKHAMPFIIRMLMFTAPIIYSSASMNPYYRFIYSLNPIVAVIEGFRASVLGLPFEWLYIFPGVITSILLFVSGVRHFKRMEGIFADVI
jgi:lipopolysaccharide transport system permease protein